MGFDGRDDDDDDDDDRYGHHPHSHRQRRFSRPRYSYRPPYRRPSFFRFFRF